ELVAIPGDEGQPFGELQSGHRRAGGLEQAADLVRGVRLRVKRLALIWPAELKQDDARPRLRPRRIRSCPARQHVQQARAQQRDGADLKERTAVHAGSISTLSAVRAKSSLTRRPRSDTLLYTDSALQTDSAHVARPRNRHV